MTPKFIGSIVAIVLNSACTSINHMESQQPLTSTQILSLDDGGFGCIPKNSFVHAKPFFFSVSLAAKPVTFMYFTVLC